MTVSGRLVLVGTPIGNLADLSARATEVLGEADAIACEDTRRTGKLLALSGIDHGRLLVVNDHTEEAMIPEIIGRIDAGETVAMVSDAGMPGLADPGEVIVSAVLDADQPVEVVPGPSAALSALVISGLPTRRFVFEGFLARRSGRRARRLAELATEERTIVLYEAPHRLAATLTDLEAAFGPDRQVVIAREITKLHEEVWRGTLHAAVDQVRSSPVRGEYTLVVGGVQPSGDVDDHTILAAIEGARSAGASTRDAAAEVARELGVAARRVYELAVGR